MQVFEKIEHIQNHLEKVKKKGKSVGFVPTMGALHEGHLTLIRAAQKENDVVVCSIFVNPIQFNNPDDLKKYPQQIEADIKLLENESCDFLFHPSVEEMYPEPSTEEFDLGDLDKVLEGEYRPGHFNGVAVVVKKLLEIVKPDRAYFGLKDYQQLLIIYKLTQNYNIPVEIVPCITIREEDGLALSSRNKQLSPAERRQAPMIYETLKSVKIQSGYTPIREVKEAIEDEFKRTKNMKLEYFEIVDMYSLKPLKAWAESKNVIALIAVYLGNVRLIDNIILFS